MAQGTRRLLFLRPQLKLHLGVCTAYYKIKERMYNRVHCLSAFAIFTLVYWHRQSRSRRYILQPYKLFASTCTHACTHCRLVIQHRCTRGLKFSFRRRRASLSQLCPSFQKIVVSSPSRVKKKKKRREPLTHQPGVTYAEQRCIKWRNSARGTQTSQPPRPADYNTHFRLAVCKQLSGCEEWRTAPFNVSL